jgi:hypothetical protein
MLSLRNYKNSSKIKNSYIIIMAKRKKNNMKFKTKIGGQAENTVMNDNSPKIKDTIIKFAEIWLQVFNNISIYTLDKVKNRMANVSRSFGIDPDRSLKDEFLRLGQTAEQFNDVLNSPEGKRALLNLKNFFVKISTEVIIPSSKELAEGLIENVEPIITKGEHAVFALLSASPFGAVMDIPRFLSESLGVAEKSVTLVNNVLQIGTDTVDKVNDQKSNFDKVVSDFGSIVDKANLKISSGLDNVRDSVNKYGENIMNETTSTAQPPIEIQSLKTRKRGKSGGKLLKKLKRDAKMIGGRIIKSQTEFLRSNVKGSQYKTKRRQLNRKPKSRRR